MCQVILPYPERQHVDQNNDDGGGRSRRAGGQTPGLTNKQSHNRTGLLTATQRQPAHNTCLAHSDVILLVTRYRPLSPAVEIVLVFRGLLRADVPSHLQDTTPVVIADSSTLHGAGWLCIESLAFLCHLPTRLDIVLTEHDCLCTRSQLKLIRFSSS